MPAEANGRVLRGEIAETSVEWEGTEQETEKVGCLLHETREKDEWIKCLFVCLLAGLLACYAFLVDASFFSLGAFFGLQAFLDLAALGLAGYFFVSSSFSSSL